MLKMNVAAVAATEKGTLAKGHANLASTPPWVEKMVSVKFVWKDGTANLNI